MPYNNIDANQLKTDHNPATFATKCHQMQHLPLDATFATLTARILTGLLLVCFGTSPTLKQEIANFPFKSGRRVGEIRGMFLD